MESYKMSDLKSKKPSELNHGPKRVPLHQQSVFTAENRPGFKRMWVNEAPGLVESYNLAGWKAVLQQDMATHNGQIQFETQMDSVVRRVVNRDIRASWKTAVLMEIPLEIYEEDQRAEQKVIDDQEKSWTQKSTNPNEYGEASISRK